MSGLSESTDAEGLSSSIKEDIIRGLNEDLAREYKAIIQYVVFSSTLKGAEYGNIAGELEKHASEELESCIEGCKTDRLSGWYSNNQRRRSLKILKIQKKCSKLISEQNRKLIKNYRERIRQAEQAGEYALSEVLREIIAQEQDHEIDLKDALGLR